MVDQDLERLITLGQDYAMAVSSKDVARTDSSFNALANYFKEQVTDRSSFDVLASRLNPVDQKMLGSFGSEAQNIVAFLSLKQEVEDLKFDFDLG